MNSQISRLLEAPLCVSGWVQGLDKTFPSSSCDIDALREFHVTV